MVIGDATKSDYVLINSSNSQANNDESAFNHIWGSVEDQKKEDDLCSGSYHQFSFKSCTDTCYLQTVMGAKENELPKDRNMENHKKDSSMNTKLQ